MRRSSRWIVVAVALASTPGTGEAQGFRGWTSTSVQLVELRPIGLDSVSRSEVSTDSEGRFFFGDAEVTCVLATICTGYFAMDDERTLAATQDLAATLWGLGIQGLSITAHVRGRARAGGDVAWPRSDDEFDALLAYVQLVRGPLRVRAGRVDVRSGLGLSAFDGGSASYAAGSYRAEVYGGRSLARGLREPQNEAFRGLDDFLLDQSVLVVGAVATGRPWDVPVTVHYQREILRDRSSLVSERISIDASRAFPRARLDGSIDYDFSFQRPGKGHVTLSVPLADGRWLVETTARRYVPYFDLSTLWGIFEPVSYSEVTARVGWSAAGAWGGWIVGGWRRYGNTETVVVLQPLRDTGWRANAGARWTPAPAWSVDASYDLEWGPGGFLSSGQAGLHLDVTESLSASMSVLSFQQIEEYRLGEGRAFGGTVSAAYALGERLLISAGGSLIRHRDGGNVFTSPWNQARAWSSLQFEIGGDPGLGARGGGE
jgi:hypothetical protein